MGGGGSREGRLGGGSTWGNLGWWGGDGTRPWWLALGGGGADSAHPPLPSL